MISLKRYFAGGLFLAAAMLPARAGSFNSDFNSGAVPAGTAIYGSAVVEPTEGTGNSGCLKLTKMIGSQSGSFLLDDLDAGTPIYGFDVSYDVLLYSSGTPADGMSLCYGPDLPNGTWGEEGTGNGLRFSFDTYDNGTGTGSADINPRAPSIDVAVGGTKLATSKRVIATITTNAFVHVHIRLNADGSLNFDYRGQTLFTNFFIPGYQALVDAAMPGRFGFGARTGGSYENAFVDNLQITTFLQPMVGISQQPLSQTVLQGHDATFDVRVANTNGATFQWMSNGVPITDATTQTLIVSNVQSAASGGKYSVAVTGPNNSVTSSEATLTVVNLTLPASPQLSFDFNDGLQPLNTINTGSAFITGFGGVTNSGVLQLTTAANNLAGAFIISDPAGGLPVYGFTARFQMLVGGGTTPPADGFAFAFGTDIPDIPSGEFENGAGLGNGLRVTFDIYNNDTIFGVSNPVEAQPAPSIDVRFGSEVIATKQFPLSFMETAFDVGLQTGPYGDTIVQLNPDSTLNVVYRGVLIYDRLPVPAFGSFSGARFAIAARTGGLNENMWVDNVELTTDTTPGTVRITSQPTSQTILVTHAYTNTVTVNNPTGTTYQWYRADSAISGATDTSYVIPSVAMSDSGAVFSVRATQASVTVTSVLATLTVANLTAPTSPNLTFNFDDGLVPAGTATFGGNNTTPPGPPGGYITTTGGVNDSGVFHLTDNVNGQSGALVISNLFGGAQVSAIAASWDARLGGGSGNAADGYSFNFANNLPHAAGSGENGTGNGIRVCFDIYGTLADSPPAPNVKVTYKGSLVASIQVPKAELETGSDFRRVLLRVDSDGKLYFAYGERVFFNGLQLPIYSFISSGEFGFYGRTGGENENQWIDNIRIQATQSSGPLSITAQPVDTTVISGRSATFTVGLSDPNNATYQWYKNNTAIGGATGSSYTTPPTTTADNGALFKVTANGPSGSVTSTNVMLTVIPAITINNPVITYDFDDCAIPLDTILTGTGEGFGIGGYIATGGLTNTCCLHLTDAAQGEHGTFIVPDLNTNAPVKAFTIYFAALIGGAGATAPPADGISVSFVSSNEVPANVQPGEGGLGNGLIVNMNLYNGGNPYFGITYHGARVATLSVPYTEMVTGDAFADTFIRLNENGTVDVQFNGKVIFSQVQLPGYTPVAGYEYVFAGRTGGLWINQWLDNIQIATSVGYVPIPLGFTATPGGLRLTWGEGFKLQSTDSLSPANWQDEPNITSGMTIPIGPGNKFYRLVSLP